MHRDLKPENILFYDNTDSSKVIVVDFGLSEYEEELSKDSPVCGTATYLAPEVWYNCNCGAPEKFNRIKSFLQLNCKNY